MKRFFNAPLIGAVLLCVCLVLTVGSCKKKNAASEGPVHIVYYLWNDPGYKAIVEAFNASQSEIVVDAEYLENANYEVKITTLLTGQTEMDAYMQKRQADMFPHYNNGFIAPIDSYLNQAGVDRSGIDNYKNALTVDGKVVAVPFRGAGYYTYYNRKLFEKAGVPTPDSYVKDGTWTWAKFAEVAEKISGGDIYGSSVYFWGSSQMIPQAQKQASFIEGDGSITTDNLMHDFFKLRKSLEEKKAMWPLIDMRVTNTHYSKQFFDGRVGMLLIGEWFPGQLYTGFNDAKFKDFGWEDWGITRLPCDVTPYVTMGAPTFNHVVAYSKKKEAAFKFIAWMGGVEGAKIVAEGGILPAVTSAEVNSILAKSVPDAGSLEYFVEKKVSYPIGMNKYGSAVEAFIQTSIGDQYLQGQLSDSQFDAVFLKGMEEIVATTD
jgi:multiple sugar transport system substrate-binding protein